MDHRHASRNNTGEDAPAPLKKKKVLVARRPRPSEGRLFEKNSPQPHAAVSVRRGRLDGGSGDHLPSTAVGKLVWLPDGHVLEKSVLGTAAAFEEVPSKTC